MKLLGEGAGYSFYKLETAQDVDGLAIIGFDYFKGFGVLDYAATFKAWMRRFPRPVFLVALKNRKDVAAWVYIDEWESVASDGNPGYVLRSIETLPELRGNKLGMRLLMLGLAQTAGYMLTKPMNPGAQSFFKKSGFKEEREFRTSPFDLSKHSGYMVLTIPRKKLLLDLMPKYFDKLY